MVDDIADDLENLDNVRRSIGLDGAAWNSLDPEERWKFADQFRSEQMQLVGDMVGKMTRWAMGEQSRKIIDADHTVVSIETGDNLLKTLPSEFALLGDDYTKYEFYRRYLEKELLQDQMSGADEAGKGPAVICIDQSGSMSGKPIAWAVAVAEAMRRICQKADRDCHVIFFNGYVAKEFNFPKGTGTPHEVLQFLGTRASGGTAFAPALDRAMEVIREQFSDDVESKADIVFITDGMSNMDGDFLRQFNADREEMNVKVFGIFVGGASDYAGAPTTVLEQFSNVVIPVQDLTAQATGSLFGSV